MDEVAVITGLHVEWTDTRNCMKMVTPLENPVGPSAIVGVSATTITGSYAEASIMG